MLDKDTKKGIIAQFRRKENDTGSVEVQVALLTERINRLTQHLKSFPQDKYCKHALQGVIGKQKRLLSYLRRTNVEQYHSLVSRLGLRK
jgi:small subunit ribosomal protein S15